MGNHIPYHTRVKGRVIKGGMMGGSGYSPLLGTLQLFLGLGEGESTNIITSK